MSKFSFRIIEIFENMKTIISLLLSNFIEEKIVRLKCPFVNLNAKITGHHWPCFPKYILVKIDILEENKLISNINRNVYFLLKQILISDILKIYAYHELNPSQLILV